MSEPVRDGVRLLLQRGMVRCVSFPAYHELEHIKMSARVLIKRAELAIVELNHTVQEAHHMARALARRVDMVKPAQYG